MCPVIDVHQDWSGSCADVVESFFRKLWMETEGKVRFLSASRPKMDAKLKTLFPSMLINSSATKSNSTSNSLNKSTQSNVNGDGEANGVLPDGSTPLFLFVKNEQLVCRLVGLDTGMISMSIKQHLSIK